MNQERQLPHHDFLQRELGLGRRIPYQHQRPAFAQAERRNLHRLRYTDRLESKVCPAPLRHPHYRRCDVALAWLKRSIGTEPASRLQARGIKVHPYDSAAPRCPQSLKDPQTDQARADHHRAVIQPDR